MVKFVLLLSLLLFSRPVRAETTDVRELGAISFYETYHTNILVPLGDSLYFCTRAKAAENATHRFRTLGFTVRSLTGGRELVSVIAAGESLTKLSSESREEGGKLFLYDLYRVESSRLLQRLRQAAHSANLAPPMPDSPIQLLIDGILILTVYGIDSGSIRESENGGAEVQGTVYETEEAIRSSMNWREGTDFSSYFNILVTLFLRDEGPEYRIRAVDPMEPAGLEESSCWKAGEGGAYLKGLAEKKLPDMEFRLSAEELAFWKREEKNSMEEANRYFAEHYLRRAAS